MATNEPLKGRSPLTNWWRGIWLPYRGERMIWMADGSVIFELTVEVDVDPASDQLDVESVELELRLDHGGWAGAITRVNAGRAVAWERYEGRLVQITREPRTSLRRLVCLIDRSIRIDDAMVLTFDELGTRDVASVVHIHRVAEEHRDRAPRSF